MRKKLSVVLFCMLIILLAGCSGGGGNSSGGSNDTDTVASNIGPSGGSVTIHGGDAGLNVPAGALSNETSITVSKSNKSTPPGSIAVSYDYTPDGQTFTSPVTICIKYDPDSIPEGMSPSDLRLARLSDNGEWETIGASTVDTTNHLVCGQTSHFSTYTVVIHERKTFGEQTGEFNSVIAYSNGTTENISNEYNTSSGYTTGMKWLCDEYVNRYYKQVYDQEIRIAGQSPKDYYQKAAERGLVAYPNDGTIQPQTGDILVSEYGEGHIAIVREVQDNKIFVIQQNWSDNGADDRYPITREGNHVYPFDGKKGNYTVKGWLRANSEAGHSISGQVTYQSVGLSGVTITLTGATTATATTDSSGNYNFNNAQNGSYTITASKSGYSFSPTSISATVNNANLTDQDFTADASTHTISGKVSGDVAAGVTITLTGSGSSTTTTDSGGNYRFTGAVNGNYTVTPSLAGYTFSPVSKVVTVDGANETGNNFTSTLYVEPTYSISGKISGDVQGGVIVTLTGKSTSSATTDGSGNYNFSGLTNGNYTITPSKTNYTFSPTVRNVNLTGVNVTGQDFTSTENTYTIAGTVSGAVVSGVTITLTGSGSTTTTTDGSGNYIFTGAKNGSYTITASKTGYTFNPTSISATVNFANLTGQNFTSTENTYGISGTITSDSVCFTDVTVTLTGASSSSTTTDSSGNYILSGVKNGNYTITPSKAGYTFTPASTNVTINNADLTGQSFTVASFPHGSLDKTFGACGVVTTEVGGSAEYYGHIAIQSDGKIVEGGAFAIAYKTWEYAFVRYNIDGSLDTTFGINGIVTSSFGTGNDINGSIAIQSDGKIVSGGSSWNGYDWDFAIARYNTNGSFDTTFSTDGKVTTKIGGSSDYGINVFIQSDGKIILPGDYKYGTIDGKSVYAAAIARFDSSGSLDTTFGTSGKVKILIGIDNNFGSVAIQSDGKIVAAGRSDDGSWRKFTLVRYNTDGSLDTTFGSSGIVITDTGTNGNNSAGEVAIQSDGKIIAAGSAWNGSDNDFTIVRYNTDGSLDTTFGINGIVRTAFGSGDDYLSGMTILSNGKIMASGYTWNGTNYDFAIAKYNTDGSLDTAFGIGGKITTSIRANDAYAGGISIQSDGKIVVAGRSSDGSKWDYATVRYWP